MKPIHIFGGGTVQYVRAHLALCAPAYGTTASLIHKDLTGLAELHLTKMADKHSSLETNTDIANKVAELLLQPEVKAIVFNVALCDFTGQIEDVPSGKYATRLKSREGELTMQLAAAPKILKTIKEARPDIFLVGFKTTAGDPVSIQCDLAVRQIAETGADLVVANDTITRENIIVFKSNPKLYTQCSREEALFIVQNELRKHST